jgi:hypothetical protein
MRLVRIFVCGIALLTALVNMTGSARAQSRDPIRITKCDILRYITVNAHPFWRPFGPYPYGSLYTDGIQIVYMNTSPKTATRVAFLVNYRGDVQHIIDVGTFSPNISINHEFGQFTGDAWLGPKPNVCRAVAVRFSDGTVWRRTP